MATNTAMLVAHAHHNTPTQPPTDVLAKVMIHFFSLHFPPLLSVSVGYPSHCVPQHLAHRHPRSAQRSRGTQPYRRGRRVGSAFPETNADVTDCLLNILLFCAHFSGTPQNNQAEDAINKTKICFQVSQKGWVDQQLVANVQRE